VLANAGYFFRTADRELAAGLLQRAIRMDPKEAGYSETLGHVYANAALGVTQERYGDAASRVDAKLAQSAFAKRALAILDESTDVPMLRRAGFLFTMSGTLARGPLGSKLDFVPDAFAEKLLLRARYLAPDAETLAELCQHYRLRALREKDSAAKAHLSWQELDVLRERQALATNEYQHSSLLVEQARAAYGARDPKSAGEFARQLLTWAGQHPENSGDAIHQANTILGLVAVDGGDLGSAAQFLIASGKMSGSPVLGSFGPSMRLAQALLQVGKPEPVLEYFRLCAAFWDMGKDRLDQWTKAVDAGRMPAFEASLVR
jgi:hypothetical protein